MSHDSEPKISYNSEHVQSQVILQTHIWYKTKTCKGASNLQYRELKYKLPQRGTLVII